jgi:hypothetical protein
MNKPPLPEPADQPGEPSLEDSFYEVPAELQETQAAAPGETPPPDEPAREHVDDADHEDDIRPRRSFPVTKVVIAVAVLTCAGAVVVAFRAQERRRAVREGIARAEQLMRLDTADTYRRAADLLAPHAQLDPLEAGSARAFALAMLAADYRDTQAEAEANALLVVPGRASTLPRHAALAFAALALGKNGLGDATSALSGAAGTPWAEALQARIALRAGTLDAAVEPATSAAAVAGFVPGLAVHGDVARRSRHDPQAARAAYEAALAASPTHPRAAYGLAKLALGGQALEAEAREALGRVLGSGEATPAPERARAALHLAALRLRAGEPLQAVRQEAAASVPEKALDWLMGAARAEAANRGAYRAVAGAPLPLESASDDDPPDLRPLAPEPPPPPPPPAAAAARPSPKAKPVAHAAKHVAKVGKAPARAGVAKGAAAKAPAKKPAPKSKAPAKKKP